jgi:hypothetical protein
MEPELGSQDWRTLELSPLWVLCAVTGRQSGFHPLELAAFWRSVDNAAAGAQGLANAVPVSLSSNFSSLLKGFEQEQRSVVTGLWDVVGILSRLDMLVAKPFVAMLLEIGESFSRARGSFGQVISREDRQTLLLLAALLELEPAEDAFDRDAFA